MVDLGVVGGCLLGWSGLGCGVVGVVDLGVVDLGVVDFGVVLSQSGGVSAWWFSCCGAWGGGAFRVFCLSFLSCLLLFFCVHVVRAIYFSILCVWILRSIPCTLLFSSFFSFRLSSLAGGFVFTEALAFGAWT